MDLAKILKKSLCTLTLLTLPFRAFGGEKTLKTDYRVFGSVGFNSTFTSLEYVPFIGAGLVTSSDPFFQNKIALNFLYQSAVTPSGNELYDKIEAGVTFIDITANFCLPYSPSKKGNIYVGIGESLVFGSTKVTTTNSSGTVISSKPNNSFQYVPMLSVGINSDELIPHWSVNIDTNTKFFTSSDSIINSVSLSVGYRF